MMKRHDDGRGRRQPVRRSARTALVYCGGVSTEPVYFEGLKDAFRGRHITIKIRSEGLDPQRLVRAAAMYRDHRPGAFDEVWCVVDVDEFDIASAVREAKRHRIHMAVSNPCFELWLLLHHADCRGHCAGYADVVARLKRHVPAYDKARLDFGDYAEGVGDAVKRGRDLDPSGAGHQRNPSTGVWRLVETIMEG